MEEYVFSMTRQELRTLIVECVNRCFRPENLSDNATAYPYLNDLKFSVRTANVLNCNKIYTVEQLLALGRRGFLRLRNTGKASLIEVEKCLVRLNVIQNEYDHW